MPGGSNFSLERDFVISVRKWMSELHDLLRKKTGINCESFRCKRIPNFKKGRRIVVDLHNLRTRF